jgi:hypothetical protein
MERRQNNSAVTVTAGKTERLAWTHKNGDPLRMSFSQGSIIEREKVPSNHILDCQKNNLTLLFVAGRRV